MVKPIAVGETVWAKWPGSIRYFKATVKVLVNNKFKVAFDVNGHEAVVERKHINVSLWSIYVFSISTMSSTQEASRVQ